MMYHNPIETADAGFGHMTPCQAIIWLQFLYAQALAEEMATNAQRLYIPMNHDLLLDVMLKEMDDIQFAVISFPKFNHKFSHQQMIDTDVINLKSTGAIHSKAIEKWGQITLE